MRCLDIGQAKPIHPFYLLGRGLQICYNDTEVKTFLSALLLYFFFYLEYNSHMNSDLNSVKNFQESLSILLDAIESLP